MGIAKNEINFDNITKNLANCCLTEEKCGACKEEKCLIGYSKKCILGCFKNDVTYVENGFKNIPSADAKLYDQHNLVVGISDILKQCRSCKEDHYDNCIINVLRSCYEVILFGETQKYDGSALVYLNEVKDSNKEIMQKIMEEYLKK
ncbi:hypothetical protein CLOACE_13970 [Clostridium acetireducens DSM 10703]|uniref:Uncharacterized protein n=1 Tax=Clostridium acetireducens DSM 10703 TaxID=1121290 RepID=A0A1E8EYT6_9CLOT|nr:hypothetical protein [Clostridium acetireducens]OFI06016.1 hypothetical protein CLOACE_13970 [Clostridium acetireducens DSM 10703]